MQEPNLITLDPSMSAADLVRDLLGAMGRARRDDVALDLQMGQMTLRLAVTLTELNGGPVTPDWEPATAEGAV